MTEKVFAGQALSISARTWNKFVDAANAFSNSKLSSKESKFSKTTYIFVQNNSGQLINEFEVLGIEGIINDMSDEEVFLNSDLIYNGKIPNDDQDEIFCIAQEPIGTDEIGLAILTGVSKCRISIEDSEHVFAGIASGNKEYLKSSNDGSAKILWADDSAGPTNGVVLLNNHR